MQFRAVKQLWKKTNMDFNAMSVSRILNLKIVAESIKSLRTSMVD